jgi:hypothetical protein
MVKFTTHCDPNPRTDCAPLTGRSGTGYFMQRTGFAVRLPIAALAFAASAVALAPSIEAAPAETCLKAPKGVAPQGSHWYYRVDRATQHRCWYLGEKGGKVAQRSRTHSAPAQAEPDDDDDAAPAPVATAPAARTATAPAARVAPAPAMAPAADDEPQPAAEAPAPKITTLVTRNVSNADQPAQPATAVASPAIPVAPPTPAPLAQDAVAPTAVPAPSTDAPVAAVPAPAPQPAPRVIAEQPPAPAAAAPQAASVAPQAGSIAPAPTPTLLLVLGGIAFFGLIASAAFFILTLLRRRDDVLHIRREADVLPYEHSPDMAAEDGATFQPLRALDPIRRRDDVDEAMQRVMRRRRAAA